jgi:single-strand DNA-binding protein
VAVARFRIASTPRYRDNATGEWKDGDTLFLTCQVWRQAAENAAETKDGEKRTVYELQVDEAGPSLRNATAKVTKTARPGNGQAADAGDAGDSGGFSDEPPF